MTRKYIVSVWAQGSHPEIDIDQNQFDQLKHAKDCLSGALSIEEKYELLLSNYLDLEKERLTITAENMLRRTSGYSSFFDLKLVLNRRLVNLLTSIKLYADQIQQHAKECAPDNASIKPKIKSFFSAEYDDCFEYRFMEALRNYVQHRGLAVHSTSKNSGRTSRDENTEFEYSTSLFADKTRLEGDNAFKKTVWNEMPDAVDLMFASKVYVECISSIHCEIRDLISQKCEESRNLILKFIEEYKAINNGQSIGLNAICLIQKDPLDETVERFSIMLDWDNIRVSLIEKNSKLTNLSKRYVSGSTVRKKIS